MSLFIGWVVDTRIYKPKRHWQKLQHWARDFQTQIHQESNYAALRDKEMILYKRFKKADKYICQSATNPMFHDLYKKLQIQKDNILFKFNN